MPRPVLATASRISAPATDVWRSGHQQEQSACRLADRGVPHPEDQRGDPPQDEFSWGRRSGAFVASHWLWQDKRKQTQKSTPLAPLRREGVSKGVTEDSTASPTSQTRGIRGRLNIFCPRQSTLDLTSSSPHLTSQVPEVLISVAHTAWSAPKSTRQCSGSTCGCGNIAPQVQTP